MRKILRKLLPITFTLAVATAVTFSTPVFVERAYAAPMEDCDLDGYDDHTGKPVPWRGFDATKGDEVPSDWDGVSDSYVFKNNKSDSSKSNLKFNEKFVDRYYDFTPVKKEVKKIMSLEKKYLGESFNYAGSDYKGKIFTGDFETEYNNFLKELDNAGIDKVLEYLNNM